MHQIRHGYLRCRGSCGDGPSKRWNDGQVRDGGHQVDESSCKSRVDAVECEAQDIVQRSVARKEIGMHGDALQEYVGSGSVDGQFREVHLKGTADPDITNADGDGSLQV